MERRVLGLTVEDITRRIAPYLKGHVIVAFLLFLALPAFRVQSIPAFSITRFLVHCVVFAACLCSLARMVRRGGEKTLRLSIMDMLVAGFYVLYLTAGALSENRELSFSEVSGEFFMMALYVFFRVILAGPSRSDFIEKTSMFAALAAVSLSLWGLAQYFFEIDVPHGLKLLFKTHHFPVVASMGNPNFLAEFIVLSLPPAFHFLLSRKSPVPLVVASVVAGLAVFLTYSRLGWFAMAFALLLLLASGSKVERRRLVVAMTVIAVITGLFFVYHYRTGSTRSDRVLKSFEMSTATPLFERTVIYRAGLSMLGDAGFSGMGPGMFGYRYLEYQGRELHSGSGKPIRSLPVDLDHAHNDLIEIGVDLGYGALAFFILLIGFGVVNGARSLVHSPEGRSPGNLALVPLIYLPFCLWSFAFYLPFSKLILLLSLAFIASGSRHADVGVLRPRVVAPLLSLLLVAFMAAETRYALSVRHYEKGLAYFKADFEKSFGHFRRGVELYPYNGYNYFSMGALFLNHGRREGVGFLKESNRYFSNSSTYLYIARGLRDHGSLEESMRWYRYLLFVRPDIRRAHEEYREILDRAGKR